MFLFVLHLVALILPPWGHVSLQGLFFKDSVQEDGSGIYEMCGDSGFPFSILGVKISAWGFVGVGGCELRSGQGI